ncbi:DUF7782 domain-containing protein [Corynebacterium hindlerae]|uniref:DUF7782 domain-containing protein n=1 Tax=Corynebacterium hindlerae TaxID=699041 RepID=UPI003AAEDCFF
MTFSPSLLADLAPNLRELFRTHNFTVSGISDYLGPAATDAWRRGEPEAVRRKLGADPLGVLIAAFILKDPVTAATAQLVSEDVLAQLTDNGRVAADIMPHVINDTDHWVFSDVDASLIQHVPGPDHVLGVGAASLSLLGTVPLTPVQSLLDLGTGSGVQVLGQLGVVKQLTGTDVHGRALDYARATLAGHSHVELLQGSWFEPVTGRRFDRIVANPPFVVGLPEVGHVYRDSGLNLDGASELVISQLVDHLEPGGTAHVLAAWVHTDAERWQQRVASWLPDNGVCAWVVQRDVVNPEMYVGTWLRDESVDPRSEEAAQRTRVWLDHFDRHGVTGIGFGYVAMQRLDDATPSDIVAEEMPQAFTDPLRDEVTEHFLRSEWLRTVSPQDILDSSYLLRPSVATESVAVANTDSGMGLTDTVLRLVRMDGPRWSHEIDQHLLTIISGLHPAGLSLGDVIGLYCMANDLDEETLAPAALGACIDLIRHGFLIPAALIETE